MQSRSLSTGRGGFDPFDVFRQEFESMFNRLSGDQGQGMVGQLQRTCPVEIVETAQDYRIIAEVPGLNERDIEITSTGDTVTIRGVRYSQYQQYGQQSQGQQQAQQGQGQGQGQQQQQQGQEGQGYVLVSERQLGAFSRTFTLPQHVDRDRIAANYNNGLLTLTVPKSSEARHQQRRIEVRSGGQQTQGQQTR